MAKKSKPLVLSDSLAVRCRPTKLSHMVGNHSSLSVVKGFFSTGKITKTWLISGPTGSGKSTLAMILARAFNCQDFDGEPCGKCSSCTMPIDGHPDIDEINAGTTGGIERMRDLIKLAKLAPRFNFRVFIVDEAHRLTTAAAQSLLKPIEEPPPKTVWILCTTDPSRLPEALYGRCLKLFMTYPTVKEIGKRLLSIATKDFPNEVKLLKPHLKDIVLSCGCQPRNSIQALETLAAALAGNPNLSSDQVDDLIQEFLARSGSLEPAIMRFLTYIYKAKVRVPLEIVAKIDVTRVDEFLTMLWRYSFFATQWYLQKQANEHKKLNAWGISKRRWEQILGGLEPSMSWKIPLLVCGSVTDAISRSRTGVLGAEQALVWLIDDVVRKIG